VIKSSIYRGIDYKCGMLYFNDEKYQKAITEFSRIISPTDPAIYELISKCYRKLNDIPNYKINLELAMKAYTECGDIEKAQQMKDKL